MSELLLIVGGAIAAASVWGAAYLLSLWHEDRAELIAAGRVVSFWRTWSFSRVLAYVAVACTLASNYLMIPTTLRVFNVSLFEADFRTIQAVLTPFTIAAIVVLDVAFVVIALYLRGIRRRRRNATDSKGLAIPVDEGEEAASTSKLLKR